MNIKRTYAIGSKLIVLHPGCFLKQTVEEGISLIAYGINKMIENTKETDVIILLETMAGKGTEVGRTFEELKQIMYDAIERVNVSDSQHIEIVWKFDDLFIAA